MTATDASTTIPHTAQVDDRRQRPDGTDDEESEERGRVTGPQHRPGQGDQHDDPCERRDPEREPVRVEHQREKLSMMLMTAGPMTATKSAGRMQKMSGIVILTGTCCAFSSAR
jgi:hypothetical protein